MSLFTFFDFLIFYSKKSKSIVFCFADFAFPIQVTVSFNKAPQIFERLTGIFVRKSKALTLWIFPGIFSPLRGFDTCTVPTQQKPHTIASQTTPRPPPSKR